MDANRHGRHEAKQMKVVAARLVEHGKPVRVEEVDLPEPGEGEVIVDLAFAGVNPVDHYGALGRVAADGPVPRTLGTEASGWVNGRAVMVGGHGLGTRRDGLWATRAAVPEESLIDVPEGVPLEHAAAMGVAGATAWCTVTGVAKVTPEDRVLILGASGGVGSIAVSVARALGATVWGQTEAADKASWVRERGAHQVISAGADSLVDAVRELRPTVVIDPLGDGFFGAALEALVERGRLVIFGTSAGDRGDVPLQALYRKGLTVFGYGGLLDSEETRARHSAEALEAARDGRLQVVIDRIMALDQVNEAFELLAERKVQGKLVLDLRG